MKKVQWICDNCGKVLIGYDWLKAPDRRWYAYTTGSNQVLDFCSKFCMDERLRKGVKRK